MQENKKYKLKDKFVSYIHYSHQINLSKHVFCYQEKNGLINYLKESNLPQIYQRSARTIIREFNLAKDQDKHIKL